jgi:hypothetical protein
MDNNQTQLPEPATKQEHEIRDTLKLHQGIILDALQIHYGDTPEWQSARRTVLKVFGTNGLEKKMREIITT